MNEIPIRDESIVLKKEVEDDDPFEMVGIGFDGQSEAELKDMALCFAEEFIREGWDEMELFYLFQSPLYVGPHMVWKQKGDEFVKAVIAEAVSMWRPRLIQTTAAPGKPKGGI